MGSNIEYIGTAEAARLLQMTGRRVVGLCSEGKLSGAFRSGRNWKIPVDSIKQYMKDTGIGVSAESKEDVRNLLPVAIGNTSYIEVSSECYYVDKTLLIRDLIDDHNMVTLFTRPRRFGKTLAINTIKTLKKRRTILPDILQTETSGCAGRNIEPCRVFILLLCSRSRMLNTIHGKSPWRRSAWS